MHVHIHGHGVTDMDMDADKEDMGGVMSQHEFTHCAAFGKKDAAT